MKKNFTIRDILTMAIEALAKNRMRSILATLGIIIGISTLLLVLGIANGAKNLISDQLASFGSDTLFVEVKVPDTDQNTSSGALASGVQIRTMKIDDVIGVRRLSNVKDSYSTAIAQEKVVYLQNSQRSFIYGTTPSFVRIDASKVATGRYFTDAENESLSKVVILGNSIKNELFGNQDPIGKTLRIRNINFKVIGVMEKRGGVLFQNYDDYVYVPLKTLQKQILGYDHLPYFVVQLKDTTIAKATAEDVRRFLRRQHQIKGNDPKKDDFEITTTEDAQSQIDTAFGAVSILFSGIAAISLIVGGVGIMNIMYVSVTERIREIGLRKAIGAKKKAILLQFLLEALTVTLLGGILGILFGLLFNALVSAGAKAVGFNLYLSVSFFDIALSVGVTAAFGIVFGLGPARKAANLRPIQALRSE